MFDALGIGFGELAIPAVLGLLIAGAVVALPIILRPGRRSSDEVRSLRIEIDRLREENERLREQLAARGPGSTSADTGIKQI